MERYLNKVIFINSASLRYAQLDLRGNIHFVGSNGSGKTTALRAILFFYNPTTERRELGIRDNQKTFSDYYFETPSSYIVYEVNMEDHVYCIICYRRGGRLQFRIMDAAYQKELFMYQADGGWVSRLPEDLFEVLRENGIRFNETPIEKYGELRNIIYGATKLKEFRQYGIFRSRSERERRKTASIPKAISNIYRSSGLDSDYMKRSIIDAVVEGEQKPIDLDNIRRNLSTFRRQLDDLETFLRNKEQAEKIIVLGQELSQKEQDLELLAHRLGRQYQVSTARLDELDAVYTSLQQQRETQVEAFLIEDERYKDAHGALRERIGALQSALSEIEKIRKRYQSISWDGETCTVEQLQVYLQEEPRLQDRLVQQERDLKLFTTQVEEVKVRFDSQQALRAQELQQFKLANQERQQQVKSGYQTQRDTLSDRQREQEATLLERFSLQRSAQEGAIEQSRLSLQEVLIDQAKAEATPQQEAKGRLQERAALLHTEIAQIKGEQRLLEQEEQHARVVYESDRKAMERAQSHDLQLLLQEQRQLEDSLAHVMRQLDGFEGSMQDFLSQYVPEWQQTLGVLCAPEILGAKDLEPSLAPQADVDTVLGVRIRMDRLPIRDIDYTEETLVAERDRLRERLQVWEQRYVALQDQSMQALNVLAETHRKKVGRIQQQLQQISSRLLQQETEAKKIALQIEQLQETILQEQISLRTALTEKRQQIEERLAQDQQVLAEINKRMAAELDALRLLFQEQRQQLEDKQRLELSRLDAEWISHQAEAEAMGRESRQRYADMLSASGIDPQEVVALERSIQDTRKRLTLLDEARRHVFAYEQQQERLQEEDGLAREQQQLHEQLSKLKDAFGQKKQAHEQVLQEQERQIQRIEQQRIVLRNALEKEWEHFRANPQGAYPYYAAIFMQPQPSDEQEEVALGDLIRQMMTDFEAKRVCHSTFIRSIRKYLGEFRADNDLGFPTQLTDFSDEHYRAFVSATLWPFVREEKHETIREQIERQHSGIIHTIAQEVKDLSRYADDISTTISHINQDLEQSNFVGVVKSIQLDFRKKENQVFKLLSKVKELNDKTSFLPQSNLFKDNSNAVTQQESIKVLYELIRVIDTESRRSLSIEDNFDLMFRVRENNNDTGWVERLSNVGSEGTDVLVKSMIYITLLNVFKEHALKGDTHYWLHCMIDEVGKLSDSYLHDLIAFANQKNIRLIFGSPNENDPLLYHHVYKIHRVGAYTQVVKLIGEA